MLTKRLIEILRVLARELIEEGYDATDVMEKMSFSGVSDIDIIAVKEELSTAELSKYIDDAEMDTIKVFIAYLLMKDTELGIEEIYSFVFGQGRQIVWH